MSGDLESRIRAKLKAAGSPRTDVYPLFQLAREVLKWNRAVRLTALPDEDALVEALCLDALELAVEIPDRGRLADAGSGAGFPGLVLAWARPHLQVTSIEARRKKVTFQEHAARLLSLANHRTAEARVDPASVAAGAFGEPGSYDWLTAQALGTPAFVLGLAGGLLSPSGKAVFIRGPSFEESERTELALGQPGWVVESAAALEPRRFREQAVRVICARRK